MSSCGPTPNLSEYFRIAELPVRINACSTKRLNQKDFFQSDPKYLLIGLVLGWLVLGGIAAAQGTYIPEHVEFDPELAAISDAPAIDYIRREEMIPMRDGVKLYTIILIPRAEEKMPILLTRTPYGASRRSPPEQRQHLKSVLTGGDDVIADAGYIRAFQDIRGRYGSEGEYVMNRPLKGPLNTTGVDHSTDAYDTIEWLLDNIPENNRRVGMIGTSYDGFLVLMGLVHPHPAWERS